MQAILND